MRISIRAMLLPVVALVLLAMPLQAQTLTAGSNPVMVSSGQASGATTIAWKASPDYTYCEIYLSVDGGEWNEFARGRDGTKPATIKLGSSYTFRMMVYEGQAGTPKVITTLTVTTALGNPPAPGGPKSGGPGTYDPNSKFEQAGERGNSSVIKEILKAPFISEVRVQPDSRNVVISFMSTQSTPPLIEIGKVAPAPDRFGIMAFGFNSGAFSRFATEQKGRYMLDVDAQQEQLDIGATYYYIINVFNNNRNDTKRPREQVTGKFTTLPQTVKVVWERILLEDDSDATDTAEMTFKFFANYGHPTRKNSYYKNDDMDSGHNYYPNETVVIENAPDHLSLAANGVDSDGGLCGVDDRPLNGPEDTEWQTICDVNVAKGEFDLTQYPGNNVTVPFRLNSMPHGDLRFVIFGRFEITRVGSRHGEQTGTTSSALETTGPERPVYALGRVKLPPAGALPSRSICDSARDARARNSPAAPGLEAKCRAAGAAGEKPPPLALGRVKVPAAGTLPTLLICEASRGARARNSPAAPGLEAQCRAYFAAKGAAIAQVDEIVAEARGAAEADALYQQGFDIATGIFGDPALGAQGNTATGPGSLGIRDSLTAAGQRGFNASVTLHLSRNYKP
ncbi:MAG: hypothetical protein ABI857_01480 [Acidobacteriota bacterium]